MFGNLFWALLMNHLSTDKVRVKQSQTTKLTLSSTLSQSKHVLIILISLLKMNIKKESEYLQHLMNYYFLLFLITFIF